MPMPTCMPLSEGFTPLTRTHNGPGVLVHRASVGAFVTLYKTRYCSLDGPSEEGPVGEGTLRLTVGHANIGLISNMYDSTPYICENMWVDAGDEIWVSASITHTMAVYGFTAALPARTS